MKKTLIAIAALAATSAFAQSSVTMYGVLDAGYNTTTTTNATTTVKTTATGGNSKGAWQSNRIGFKGTEDMGSGTTANFVYEMAMDAGTTGDLAATGGIRQSWLSLANKGNGELTVGRQYNPIFSVTAALDAGNANNVGFGRVIYGQVATTRTSGGVAYTSPSMAGLTAKVIYGKNTKETAGVNDAADYNAKGGSLVYANGPLTVQAAMHQTKLEKAAAAGTQSDKSESVFGASYMIGKATVVAIYGTNKEEDLTGAQTKKRSGYQVGLRYPLTSTVDSFLTYGKATVQAASTAAEGKAKGVQAGAMYNLSKRTGVYAAYGKTSDDTSAAASTVVGKEIAVGIRHAF
jgi:predicted porin